MSASTLRSAPRRRWRIGWLLGLGVLVNYFDRVNLSVSHAALYTTFGISDVVFGYLSAAYNWSYALCQIPVGVVLDRFGVRRVQRLGIFIWSMASFAAAITPNLAGFFSARLLLGIGEAPTFPANAKAIGEWFPQNERSFATSLTDAAAKFASAIGVPLLGLLLLRVGWRWSFAATGAISFLFLFIFWRVYREPEEDTGLTDAERRLIAHHTSNEAPAAEGPALSLGALLRQPKVIGLSLPSLCKPYVHSGVIESVVLWNTHDLGYLTVLTSDALARGTLKRGDKTFNAGRLGTLEVKGDQVILGKPFIFNKSNIDKFDF